MKIKNIMSTKVEFLPPTATIKEAAKQMLKDFGFIPVGENDRLIGSVTDRDIVIRAVAEGKDSNTLLRDIMTDTIQYCFEEDSVEVAANKMKELKIRRLVVLNADKRMVGIVSLGDIATRSEDQALVGKLTEKVSEKAT